MSAPKKAPLFVRPEHAAELFSVNKTTLYRWSKKGLITIYKQGSMSFVSVAEITALITGADKPTAA